MAASNLDTSTTADSLIEVVKSSFLDGNYIFDDDWMVSSIKSNSCVDINEYVNKITQLQIKVNEKIYFQNACRRICLVSDLYCVSWICIYG